jgi:hypothetical protein
VGVGLQLLVDHAVDEVPTALGMREPFFMLLSGFNATATATLLFVVIIVVIALLCTCLALLHRLCMLPLILLFLLMLCCGLCCCL